jgi:hypothetical protein
MKKTLIALAAAVMIAMPAYAATTQTIAVSASVSSTLDMSMQIFERAAGTDLPTGTAIASMPYGQLVNNGFSALVGAKNYAVYLSTNSSSRKYAITASMPALTAGANTLPNAMGMTVVSAKDVANVDIVGDTLDTMQSAVMTNNEIYRSNDAGTGALIEMWYGILGYGAGGTLPFTGFVPIQLDQAAGSYASTITYTIALV